MQNQNNKNVSKIDNNSPPVNKVLPISEQNKINNPKSGHCHQSLNNTSNRFENNSSSDNISLRARNMIEFRQNRASK